MNEGYWQPPQVPWDWKQVTLIEKGDRVHRWGDWLEVVNVHVYHMNVVVDVIDDGKVRGFEYSLYDELMVKTGDESKDE